MDVAAAVIAHPLQVGVLENVQRLQHHRTLLPDGKLEDLHAAIRRGVGLLNTHAPVREVFHCEESALLANAAHDLLRDVTGVEARVGRHDRFLSRLPLTQRIPLGFNQLAKGRGQITLHKNLTRVRRLARFTTMREHHVGRVAPPLDARLVRLNCIRQLRFDRIPLFRHLQRRCQDLRQ